MHFVNKLFKTDKAFITAALWIDPLFPLCVCFALLRRCHSLPSARLPISIFHRFCPFLERMKTDEVNPEILLVRCVLLAYVFCPSASGTGTYIRSMFTFFVLGTTRFFLTFCILFASASAVGLGLYVYILFVLVRAVEPGLYVYILLALVRAVGPGL